MLASLWSCCRRDTPTVLSFWIWWRYVLSDILPKGDTLMKKIIAATVAGLLLVAGQAAATTQASARVGDRVGARAGESSELAAIPLPLVFLGAALLIGFAINEVVDDGESD